MNSTHEFLLDSLKEKPIGDTDHFIWYITDIGIVALIKKNVNLDVDNLRIENEALKISLDITKEVKEYFEIQDKRLFLFYS